MRREYMVVSHILSVTPQIGEVRQLRDRLRNELRRQERIQLCRTPRGPLPSELLEAFTLSHLGTPKSRKPRHSYRQLQRREVCRQLRSQLPSRLRS